ncbi:DNA alkylation repair protein [Citricoccus sp.]|uniref:DNA alkylation repair protein n=1 Tax=Citricoccus sp. TaxID=1978372 RepID=UPI0028BE153A|nr:DNA alkylation repair protein [Citricoccus sp.]
MATTGAPTIAPTVEAVQTELAALEDPAMRAANEKRGDGHGVNLTKLRAVAKAVKTDPASKHQLARDLWNTGDSASRLVSLLICSPKRFSRDELDEMIRQAQAPKVHDWLVNYVVKKSAHLEDLRLAWTEDADQFVASAGWDLNSHQVYQRPEVLDLPGLLDIIEAQMKDAPKDLQWAMNNTLAAIGIENPDLRPRALAIGERLEVLKDYPTPPNCTSPFAPMWISEIVRRKETAAAR